MSDLRPDERSVGGLAVVLRRVGWGSVCAVAVLLLQSLFHQPVGPLTMCLVVALLALTAFAPFNGLLVLASFGPLSAVLFNLTTASSISIQFAETLTLAFIAGWAGRRTLRPRPLAISPGIRWAAVLLLAAAAASGIAQWATIRAENLGEPVAALIQGFITRDYLLHLAGSAPITAAALVCEGALLLLIAADVCARSQAKRDSVLGRHGCRRGRGRVAEPAAHRDCLDGTGRRVDRAPALPAHAAGQRAVCGCQRGGVVLRDDAADRAGISRAPARVSRSSACRSLSRGCGSAGRGSRWAAHSQRWESARCARFAADRDARAPIVSGLLLLGIVAVEDCGRSIPKAGIVADVNSAVQIRVELAEAGLRMAREHLTLRSRPGSILRRVGSLRRTGADEPGLPARKRTQQFHPNPGRTWRSRTAAVPDNAGRVSSRALARLLGRCRWPPSACS